MKNLYDLIKMQGLKEDDGEKPLFSKVRQGGLTCASCSQDISGLHKKQMEFEPWNKLPKRDEPTKPEKGKELMATRRRALNTLESNTSS